MNLNKLLLCVLLAGSLTACSSESTSQSTAEVTELETQPNENRKAIVEEAKRKNEERIAQHERALQEKEEPDPVEEDQAETSIQQEQEKPSEPSGTDEGFTNETPEPDPLADLVFANHATWVVNKNTKKIHYPDCQHVSSIKDENRWDVYIPLDNLLSDGYTKCQTCFE